MAIVRMKKLSLLATRSQKDEILHELMRLGCVEVREQEELLSDEELSGVLTRESGDAAQWRAKKTALSEAIKLLDRYVPKKAPMLAPRPELDEARFLNDSELDSALAAANEIIALDERIRSDTAEENRQQLLIEALTPWRGFELPLETNGTRNVAMTLGTVPAAADLGEVSAALSRALPESEIFEISSDESAHYLSVFYMRSAEDAAMSALRDFGFAAPAFGQASGSAQESISAAQKMLENLAADKAVCLAQLQSHADRRDTIKVCCDLMNTHVDKAETCEKLLKTESAVTLAGWVSVPEIPALEKALARFDCAYELSEPDEEEYGDVPVELRNGSLVRPMNMVTDMYSLPAYGTVDPNPLMAPFFIVFYGMMMADMGYGLVMMLLSLIVVKKAKPQGATMRYMMPLMGLCGVSTFIWGALTGGFFGDLISQIVSILNPALYSNPPELFAAVQKDGTLAFALPTLFSPLDDAVEVLIGALILGVIQVFTGMIVSMYMKIRRGETMSALCNEGAWFLVFIMAGVGYLIGHVVPCVIAAVVVLAIAQAYGKKGFGIITGIFGSLYNGITGYFSDILSYSRLMALMLAGAVVAQVFNQLGAMTGNIVTFIIIALIGNALNFALNILGCYVHDMRLQCLEFFGRFYEDGGKPFSPLKIKTQYVTVTKK